jgi:hypothetical protein
MSFRKILSCLSVCPVFRSLCLVCRSLPFPLERLGVCSFCIFERVECGQRTTVTVSSISRDSCAETMLCYLIEVGLFLVSVGDWAAARKGLRLLALMNQLLI